jgi:pimeloyl-ACP methyl ester carboxylesterase
MTFVESVDGVKVFYEVLGEGDVPLVLIHGLGGTGRLAFGYQLYLAEKYKLVLIDLPGHGKAGKDRENYTMELFGYDVKAVVEQLDLNNVILSGFSLGGAVIVETAKLIPDKVKGLLFLDSMISSEYQIKIDEENIKEAIKPFEEDFITAWNNLIDLLTGDKFDPKDVEMLRNITPTLDKRSMISTIAEQYRWNGSKALQKIKAPMKFIIAGRSMPSIEDKEKWGKIYDIEFLEDSGHVVTTENPKAFNKLFEKRLKEFMT